MPSISAITPTSIIAGSGQTSITITGTGFIPTSAAQWNGTSITTQYSSSTNLSATVPATLLANGTLGEITVVNPSPGGGTTVTPLSFSVNNPVPAINSVSPAIELAGSADANLDIIGSGFVPSTLINWNGSALATTFVNTTEVKAVLPAADAVTATKAQLTAANPTPAGGTSAQISFVVQNPVATITSVNPTSVTAGAGATTLNITGTNFLASSVVLWNNTPLVTSFVSTTEVKAALPAADVSGSVASLISIQNPAPGGGTSTTVTFDVNSPVPAITSISPHSVTTGTAASITLTGSGFESNSIVLWNGAARPTTVVSTTVLQVTLSATDLQNAETGTLNVSNPAPGASTSAAAQLVVTSQPIPTIENVSIAIFPGTTGQCSLPQVTVTGTNFSYGSLIQANGITLQSASYSPSSTTLMGYLPLGFVSAPGALTFTVENPGQTPIISTTFSYPATNAPLLTLCATPSPVTVYAGSSFSFTVQPTEVNVSGSGTLTLGSLPTGITTSNSSVSLPSSGATLHLQAASSVAVGSYDLALNGTTGAATATGNFNFTVSSWIPPGFFFISPTKNEVGVPIGGSASIQFQTEANSSSNVDYDIVPSITGLPSGTTAVFSPSTFSPGQSVTVILSAANGAPVTQNASAMLTGTPSAQASAASVNFFIDVTQPPGSLPASGTDFVPTAGTPYAAVYDPIHNLIFSTNPDWNRVDVIANATHKIVKSIPVRSPRGIDITQDDSHVWVQTASQNLYEIDTVSLHALQYSLPNHSFGSSGLPVMFSDDKLLVLSDGTLFLYFADSGAGGDGRAAVWNPQTNSLNVLSSGAISAWGLPVRSLDGTLVYATENEYGSGVDVYSAISKSLTKIGSGTSYGTVEAVNGNGSRLVLATAAGAGQGQRLLDSSLNPLGSVPGQLSGFGAGFPLDGGVIFSPDSSKLYEIGSLNNLAVVLTIDASTFDILGTAPSASTDPVGTSGASAMATPFAVDAQGLVLGLQNYGISFDDSTFVQHYATNQPGNNGGSESFATYAGPLAGGTTSSLYVFPDETPDVWFGKTRGSASISQGELSFTSPPSTTPGPVNLKFIYPDGIQTFYPQLFSYSAFPEYSVLSGSDPNGGAPAEILGYGLPQDPSGGTLTVGGATATITTQAGQYPPLSGEPYPSTILKYTFPAGTPGWADLTVNTPIGSGVLPKSVFYARSVTDYSSSDSFSAVLVDEKRGQVYLSAGDHVDVFSTTSNQFLSPLYPAAQGMKKEFTGMALTPDGSKLLVADLLDGSLAVIDPDTPSTSAVIPVAAAGIFVNTCEVGPLYVAATSTNLAFVTTGSEPAPSCPSAGITYIVNLQTQAVTRPNAYAQCNIGLLTEPFSDGFSVDATGDGNFTAIGGSSYNSTCIYSAQNASYSSVSFPAYYGYYGIALSSDGNVVSTGLTLGDLNSDLLGTIGQPIPYYGNSTAPSSLLLRPRLNASGSLYYFAYPNYLEIVDVTHAILRMRFSLTQTIQSTASPFAIDSGGRHIYLLTDKGFTVVDLGTAPLSIGHLNQTNVSPGSQIIVRGSGFDSTTAATVGGQSAVVIFTDENTMTLTIPAAASGPEDIVLTKSDGETYTFENGVILP